MGPDEELKYPLTGGPREPGTGPRRPHQGEKKVRHPLLGVCSLPLTPQAWLFGLGLTVPPSRRRPSIPSCGQTEVSWSPDPQRLGDVTVSTAFWNAREEGRAGP